MIHHLIHHTHLNSLYHKLLNNRLICLKIDFPVINKIIHSLITRFLNGISFTETIERTYISMHYAT